MLLREPSYHWSGSLHLIQEWHQLYQLGQKCKGMRIGNMGETHSYLHLQWSGGAALIELCCKVLCWEGLETTALCEESILVCFSAHGKELEESTFLLLPLFFTPWRKWKWPNDPGYLCLEKVHWGGWQNSGFIWVKAVYCCIGVFVPELEARSILMKVLQKLKVGGEIEEWDKNSCSLLHRRETECAPKFLEHQTWWFGQYLICKCNFLLK